MTYILLCIPPLPLISVWHLLLDEHGSPELVASICRSLLKGFQGVIYHKWRRESKLLLPFAHYTLLDMDCVFHWHWFHAARNWSVTVSSLTILFDWRLKCSNTNLFLVQVPGSLWHAGWAVCFHTTLQAAPISRNSSLCVCKQHFAPNRWDCCSSI